MLWEKKNSEFQKNSCLTRLGPNIFILHGQQKRELIKSKIKGDFLAILWYHDFIHEAEENHRDIFT